MKKKIALFLVCFLLVMVPMRAYAVEPVVFGIGEEIILPFLLSLLGVQAKNTIGSYQDLKEYHETIKGTLIESLAGLAGMEQVQEWIFNVVNGLIQTDSVIWQKLYELAISNYVVHSSGIEVPADNPYGLNPFNYYSSTSISYGNTTYVSGIEKACVSYFISGNKTYVRYVGASSTNIQNGSNYTYNGKTVYYYSGSLDGYTQYIDLSRFSPDPLENSGSYSDIQNANKLKYVAWSMIYGGYVENAENVSSYSDAFSNVLASSEKDDIIDGTNVIQLYNPAEFQNGLEIIPGGDPEDDPNLRKIPFAITADWWNFLQQFGNGDNSNQYVNAYNALNGLDQGTSIGRISDAWDSLGIAAVGAAAAQAAEGILNLTDRNIYPQSQSVSDTITNSIPSNLTPETPDSGIDNDSPQGLYKLPDLRDYFPFCIPFDLIDLLSIFVAEPETPEFVIALSTGWSYAEENVSLDQWNGIANMVRNIELAVFVLGLILITRNIIRG